MDGEAQLTSLTLRRLLVLCLLLVAAAASAPSAAHASFVNDAYFFVQDPVWLPDVGTWRPSNPRWYADGYQGAPDNQPRGEDNRVTVTSGGLEDQFVPRSVTITDPVEHTVIDEKSEQYRWCVRPSARSVACRFPERSQRFAVYHEACMDSVSLDLGAGNDTADASGLVGEGLSQALPVFISGGDGNDTIRGADTSLLWYGYGFFPDFPCPESDDVLSGDGGADTIVGGAGLDVIHSAGDGAVDRVTCDGVLSEGTQRGFRDEVWADTFDIVATDCENVHRRDPPPAMKMTGGSQGYVGSDVSFEFCHVDASGKCDTSGRTGLTFECTLTPTGDFGFEAGPPVTAPCDSASKHGYRGLAPGRYTFRAYAVTIEGRGRPAEEYIEVRKPPDTKLTTAEPRRARDGRTYWYFAFEGIRETGDTGGYECRTRAGTGTFTQWDSCVFAEYYFGNQFEGLPDGDYTFEARAVGDAGPDPTPVSYTFRVPRVCLDDPAARPFGALEADLSASAVVPEQATPPAIGPWQFAGCFEKTGPNTYEAARSIKLNGLNVTSKAGGKIVVDTLNQTLTAAGEVVVATAPLTVLGQRIEPIVLHEGALDWQLKAHEVLSFIPNEAKILGLLIADHQGVIKAVKEGEYAFTGHVDLPDVLGGGKAEATAIGSMAGGLKLDALKVTGAGASIGEVVRLSKVNLSYEVLPAADGKEASQGWKVTGDVAAGTGLKGKLSYAEGKVKSGFVAVDRATIGGLFDIDSARVDYVGLKDGGGRWTGKLVQRHDPAKADPATDNVVDAELVYDAKGQLAKAVLDATNLDLFGIVRVKPFKLTYDPVDAWAATAATQLPGKDPVGAKIDIGFSGGLLTKGKFALSNIPVHGLGQIRDISLGYSQDPVKGQTTWTGSIDVVLRGVVGDPVGISGGFTSTNGEFTAASFAVAGANIPLGPLTIYKIGFDWTKDPFKLGGTVGVRAGPVVDGKSLLEIEGGFSYVFPKDGDGKTDVYDVNAKLRMADQELADARLQHWAKTGASKFNGKLGGDSGLSLPGPIHAKVELAGDIYPDRSFFAQANGSLTVLQQTLQGTVVASSVGLAGCGAVRLGWDWEAGFGYRWADKKVERLGKACGFDEFKPPAAARAHADGALAALAVPSDGTFEVAPSKDVVALRFRGETAPPRITLTAPDGSQRITPSDPQQLGLKDDHVVVQDAAEKTTYFLVNEPRAGTWTYSAAAGSSPLAEVGQASELPEPEVSAAIAGSGADRAVTYEVKPQPGQQVVFLEQGAQSARNLGTVGGGSGTLAVGDPDPAGTRTIKALVMQDGFVRKTIVVGTYTAGSAGSPAGAPLPGPGAGPAPAPGPEQQPPPAPSGDTTPPETTITRGPARTRATGGATASFDFAASEAATFQCRVDRPGVDWETCSPGWRRVNFLPGSHAVQVRAVDLVGNPDPTPAVWTWKVVRGTVSLKGLPKKCSKKDFRLAVAVTDGLPLASLSVTLDGKRVGAGTGPKATYAIKAKRLRRGSHELRVVVTDPAGNAAAVVKKFRRC